MPLQVELDDGLPDFDPAGLPPPEPWSPGESLGSPGSSPPLVSPLPPPPPLPVPPSHLSSRHDGPWFARLLRAERERMEGWCLQMEQEARDNELPQEGMFDWGLKLRRGLFFKLIHVGSCKATTII